MFKVGEEVTLLKEIKSKEGVVTTPYISGTILKVYKRSSEIGDLLYYKVSTPYGVEDKHEDFVRGK